MNVKRVLLTFVPIFMLSVMIGTRFGVVPVLSFGEANVLSIGQTNPMIASSDIIWVPDDYTKIQWAVGNASDGETIFVRNGTYYEQVTVNKSLTLIGENSSNTIIEGSLGAYVIKCNASYVNITGFTIRRGTHGIEMEYSSNSIISGNIIANNSQYGIFVVDSSNVTVVGNVVLNNGDRGIYLRSSSNNFVNNNTVLNHNEWGIYLYVSDNNVVSNNDVSNNKNCGILQIESNNNIFTGNTVSANAYGISIRNSQGNILRDNQMNGNKYNFDVMGATLREYIQDIDASNTVNGKPMYYLVNQADAQVPAGAGYVAVVNSTNITVKDQTLTNNKQGVLFAYTANSTIVNVNASYNHIGIHIIEDWVTPPKSGNNIVKDNFLANNYEGVEFRFSNDNIFTGNTVTKNYYGIASASCNNTFYHNNFIDNVNSTFECVSGLVVNIWDDGYPSGGNYWSDYTGIDMDGDGIGDTPHEIDDKNRDNYPLMAPVILVDQLDISDDRCNVGTLQIVAFHSVWAHNRSTVIEGNVYVNGTQYRTNSTGWISFIATCDTVGKRVWIITGSVSFHIIWDRVNVTLSNSRVNVNSTISIIVAAVYEYDGTDYDGVVALNDTLTKSEVGRYGYGVQSIGGDSYNITVFESNSAWVIFDAVKIVEGGVSKNRTNVCQQETVWFKAVYEYDNVVFDGTKGKLYVNGSEMTWSSENDRWEYNCSFDTAGIRFFQVSGVSDNEYGLTAINDAAGALSITWEEEIKALPFWMQWWFWAIIIVGIMAIIAIYSLRTKLHGKPSAVHRNVMDKLLTRNFFPSA